MRISGLAESTSGPAFSVAAGLLRFATERQSAGIEQIDAMPAGPAGKLTKISQWLRENF